jgi:hypothetical protein
MKIKSLFSIIIVVLFFTSCSKELSLEQGGNLELVGAPGQQCKISGIMAVDSASGKGLYNLFTGFNGTGVASFVQAVDSVNATIDFSTSFTYNKDTIFVGLKDYFVVDSLNRVKRFISDTLLFDYKYNAAGYLIEKIFTYAKLGVPLITYSYQWTNGNLTNVTGVISFLGLNQKIYEATMEYDVSKVATNFLSIFPEGYETFPFIMGLDLGKKSQNLVSKISITEFDNAGAVSKNYESLIKNVKYSLDGYITEWYVEGDGFDALGLFSGRNKFSYYCR